WRGQRATKASRRPLSTSLAAAGRRRGFARGNCCAGGAQERAETSRARPIDEVCSGNGGPPGQGFYPGRRFQHGWQGQGLVVEIPGEPGPDEGATSTSDP